MTISCARSQCFSKKRVGDGALFRFASGELLKISTKAFAVRDVALVVHAYAHAGVWDEPLFRRMGRIARDLIEDCAEVMSPHSSPHPHSHI